MRPESMLTEIRPDKEEENVAIPTQCGSHAAVSSGNIESLEGFPGIAEDSRIGIVQEEVQRINELEMQALVEQLKKARIDFSEWGTGEAKILKNLLEEIKSGEAILVTDERGGLLKKIVVCAADIRYTSPGGKKYRLKEEVQVFNDGRERRRKDLGQAVSEKMKPDENPRDAMIRGIREELGIKGEIILIETGSEEHLLSSSSYPGLQSQSIRHKFEATLNDLQFRPNGYVERQKDKSTHFVWIEIV